MKWIIIVALLAGCGGVDMAGLTGNGGAAGERRGTGGVLGVGGETGIGGGAGGAVQPCVENTIDDCRARGEPILTAVYWCADDGHPHGSRTDTTWGDCINGHLSGYYGGLPCPFDVGVATDGSIPPAPECMDGIVVHNGGGSLSAAWKSTDEVIYCCAANVVQKIDRCR